MTTSFRASVHVRKTVMTLVLLFFTLSFFPSSSYAVGSDNTSFVPTQPNPMAYYSYSFYFNNTNNNCNFTNCGVIPRTQLIMVPASLLAASPGTYGMGPANNWGALAGPATVPNGRYNITLNWVVSAPGAFNRWFVLGVYLVAPAFGTPCASAVPVGFPGNQQPLMMAGTLTCSNILLSSSPNIPTVQFNVQDSNQNETNFYFTGTVTLTRVQ